jgi:hypothetical protein
MTDSTLLYRQLLAHFRQYSQATDLRHLNALSWMVSALIASEQLNLSAWEPYIQSRATQAQSVERRWQRFVDNPRVRVESLYVPLVLAALSQWQSQRLYLAMDTTVLWDQYCMIQVSVVCCGRVIPLFWRGIELPRLLAAG